MPEARVAEIVSRSGLIDFLDIDNRRTIPAPTFRRQDLSIVIGIDMYFIDPPREDILSKLLCGRGVIIYAFVQLIQIRVVLVCARLRIIIVFARTTIIFFGVEELLPQHGQVERAEGDKIREHLLWVVEIVELLPGAP